MNGPNRSSRPSRTDGVTPGDARPTTAYSARRTVTGMVLLAALLVAGIAAASYPAVAVAVVASLLVVGVAGRVARALRTRHAGDRLPAVCVPGTDVCIGA